jgi:hypothetical protein
MVRCVALMAFSLQDPRPVVRQIFQVLVFCISERSDQSLKHAETSQETITLKKSVNIRKSLNDLVTMVKNFFNYVPYVRSQ